ncbi:hypothetical protein KDA23_07320 [Candidatus Saccharibacteria bacterium]|nr:hypothetical protein [Candidatus Saccharibacteria bacterium]
MFEDFKATLTKWETTGTEREQLQMVYLVVIVVSVLVAGLLSLVNYDAGQNLLKVSGLAIVVFATNAVVWALLDSFLLSKVRRPRTRRK